MLTLSSFFVIGFISFTNGVPDPRIVGGGNAAEGKYPYQVSLRKYGSHLCGGSIINERYILTAAHCIVNQTKSSFTVNAGTLYLNTTGDVYPVEKLIAHSDYDKKKFINDIALIRVNKNITFNNYVQPIVLSRKMNTYAGESAVVTGWGRLIANGVVPIVMQELKLSVISLRYCRMFYDNVDSKNVCTYTKFGEGVCSGDSGGPLVADGKQIGVVSYGRPCGVGSPDVFAKVAAYRSWINDHMEDFSLSSANAYTSASLFIISSVVILQHLVL